MHVWIIYDRQRIKGNERFILHFSRGLRRNGFEVETVFAEDADLSNPPRIAVMRTYNPPLRTRLTASGVTVYNNDETAILGNDKFLAYRFAESIGLRVMPYSLAKNNIRQKTESNGIGNFFDDRIGSGKKENSFSPCVPTCNYFNYDYRKRDTHDGICSRTDPKKFPIVAKSVSGHGGDEVFWLNNTADFNTVCRLVEGDLVLQEPCDTLGKDIRVYVIGGEIVAAVLRESKNDFRSNFSLGGSVNPYILSKEERKEVEKVTARLDIAYGGIDFIFHKGEIYFNEIEDIVGAKNVYMFGETDILGLYADYIAKRTEAERR